MQTRTLEFAVRIVKLCQYLENQSASGKILSKQLLRAGTSIGANIAESKGAASEADYFNKCAISCKEAHETLYWLKLIVAANLLTEQKLVDVIQECTEIVSILTSISKRSKLRRVKLLD